MYADDIIFGGIDDSIDINFAKLMSKGIWKEHNGWVELLSWVSDQGTSIHQQKHIKELLKKFDMLDSKASYTLMAITTKLDKDNSGIIVSETKYRGMIGSIMYLITSKPDILFCIKMCVRFQSCPKESYMKAIKRILRYLKGTMNLVLWYHAETHLTLLDSHIQITLDTLLTAKAPLGWQIFLVCV